jgi:galactose oxidase
MLLWAGVLCLLAPGGAQARLLKNARADYCLGVDGASKKDGADVELFECGDKPDQRWSSKRVSEGVYNVVNDESQLCMGVADAKTTPGARIEQLKCDGSNNQKWTFETCEGTPCMVNVRSQLCLSTQRLGNGVRVEQLRCEGGTNQAWTRD